MTLVVTLAKSWTDIAPKTAGEWVDLAMKLVGLLAALGLGKWLRDRRAKREGEKWAKERREGQERRRHDREQ